MKTFVLLAAIALYGGVMTGCQSTNDNNGTPARVQDNSLHDPSGNNMSHPESDNQTGNIPSGQPTPNP